MTVARTHVLNGTALLMAVGACVAIALTDAPTPPSTPDPNAAAREVRDAEGTAVPVHAYRRVASMSPIADAILLETIAAASVRTASSRCTAWTVRAWSRCWRSVPTWSS